MSKAELGALHKWQAWDTWSWASAKTCFFCLCQWHFGGVDPAWTEIARRRAWSYSNLRLGRRWPDVFQCLSYAPLLLGTWASMTPKTELSKQSEQPYRFSLDGELSKLVAKAPPAVFKRVFHKSSVPIASNKITDLQGATAKLKSPASGCQSLCSGSQCAQYTLVKKSQQLWIYRQLRRSCDLTKANSWCSCS